MTTELATTEQSSFELIRNTETDGSTEYWSARDLMPLLGYTKWGNFEKVIEKAKVACTNSGQPVENHFADVGKMVNLGSDSQREIQDYKLSRYACYLIAQNGDPKKKQIALAQTYFAIQTRRQEVFDQLDVEGKRLYVRQQVKDQNKQLFATAQQAGVSNFGQFNDAGYKGLYGGLGVKQVKDHKGIGKDDLLDRAGNTELAANLFRVTQTDEKLKKDGVKGEHKASLTHFEVGKKVRGTIKDIGGTMPEDLPAEKHIKEIERAKKKLFKESEQAKRLKDKN